MEKLIKYLYRPIHPSSLGAFRITFGLVLFAQTLYFILTGFVELNLIQPIIHFKYTLFQFLEPGSPLFLHSLMWGMLLSTVFITTGFLWRWGAAFFFFSFSYLWLLDKGYFNNHYYLMSLLTLLLFFTDANAWGGWKSKGNAIPQWMIFILKAQLFIVFFIAGINKINPYWLIDFQPVKYILQIKAEREQMPFLNNNSLAAFMCYGGLFLDLFVGFLLWFRKSRPFGIILLIGFNIINFWVFYNVGEIGFFPFMLIGSVVLFLEPQTIANLWTKWRKLPPIKKRKRVATISPKPLITGFLFCYLTFQVLFPFRHLLYPGHVDWTGEGQRFAWRMKIMLKEAEPIFKLVDANGNEGNLDVSKMLSPKQYTALLYYPDFLPELARMLKKEGQAKGLVNPKVHAQFQVSFMGSEERQAIVDPKTDLASVKHQLIRPDDWIIPLAIKRK